MLKCFIAWCHIMIGNNCKGMNHIRPSLLSQLIYTFPCSSVLLSPLTGFSITQGEKEFLKTLFILKNQLLRLSTSSFYYSRAYWHLNKHRYFSLQNNMAADYIFAMERLCFEIIDLSVTSYITEQWGLIAYECWLEEHGKPHERGCKILILFF